MYEEEDTCMTFLPTCVRVLRQVTGSLTKPQDPACVCSVCRSLLLINRSVSRSRCTRLSRRTCARPWALQDPRPGTHTCQMRPRNRPINEQKRPTNTAYLGLG